MSKTKGGGSTRNGRDSKAQRLGREGLRRHQRARRRHHRPPARAPSFHPGDNVGRGGDDTLFATADGVVHFGTRRGRRLVSVDTEA